MKGRSENGYTRHANRKNAQPIGQAGLAVSGFVRVFQIGCSIALSGVRCGQPLTSTLGVTMSGRVALLLLLFVAVVAVVKADGLNGKAVFVFSFVAVMIGISWYFYSRRSALPSTLEILAANTWLFVRRLVGFVGAIFFFFCSVMVGFALFPRAAELTLLYRIGTAPFLLLVSAFCIWVAIFGQGPNRHAWRDDVALHHENKRRYRWRW